MTIPTDYANLTGWWDASQEAFANNDPVSTLTDQSANSWHFTATGTDRPLFKTGMFPLGGSGIDFDGTSQHLLGTNLSNLMSASTGTLIAVFKANSIEAIANVWEQDAVFRSQGGVFGIILDNVASVYGVQAWNDDGASDVNNHAIVLGTTYVFAMRHSGGNLISSLNGGSETSIASGDCTDVASIVEMGRSGFGSPFFFADITLAECFTYSAARSAGEITALNDSLQTKWIAAAGGQPMARRRGGVRFAAPISTSRRW